MSRSGGLLKAMRNAGIDDRNLRRGPNQSLTAVLRSLGVESPRAQLIRTIEGEGIGGSMAGTSSDTISMGPWTQPRPLGFINGSTLPITISNETKNGTGTIEYRRKNGSSVSLPVTLQPGDLYEVGVGNITTGRVYLAYRVSRNAA